MLFTLQCTDLHHQGYGLRPFLCVWRGVVVFVCGGSERLGCTDIVTELTQTHSVEDNNLGAVEVFLIFQFVDFDI